MTDKPYTNADVEQLAATVRARIGWPISAGEAGTIVTVVLDTLAAADRLATNGRCGDLAPNLSLLASRIRQTCRLTAGHAGWHRGDDGSEWVEHPPAVGSVCQCTCHQPGRCPCKPGAPAHRHGAGGYCTVGEPAQIHHVIAFAGDGTWSLEHPATCPPGDDPSATDWDCPVRRLAEQQITADLAALMTGGRYGCSISDLRDVFQLDDRLHDDQCTPPVCAACGCWCHADEPDRDAVQDLLDDATRAFAAAGTSSERVEVIRDLLAGWYAAWPTSAVTDEHEGIAHQIAALVYAAEARASTEKLPSWVLELVAGLTRYEHDHPKLYRYGGGEAWCPCDLLKAVPAEVRAQAEREG